MTERKKYVTKDERKEFMHWLILKYNILECQKNFTIPNSRELADKYEVGQILTEKAFVDATDKIGGIFTTHRYLILSNGMADLSQFEKGTDWGIHTANVNSKFKVLDIYRKHGKTQIFLLQLPEGFEEVFTLSNNLINQRIEYSRKLFDSCLSKAIIEEVNSHDWLERVSFPLGMDENGNFF
jgi:hypothetical protein